MADYNDDEVHPDWGMLPRGGYPGQEPPNLAIFVPEYAGPEFVDDYMEVSLDDYGAAGDDLAGGEHNIDIESEEVEALLSDDPPTAQGASATVSGSRPSSEVHNIPQTAGTSQDSAPLPVVEHVPETEGQQIPPQPNPPSGSAAVNTPPGGVPIGDQHVGTQRNAQNRQTTRGRSRGANTRGDSMLHRTRGRATRPLFNAPYPRAVRGAPLVGTAPVPIRGRGTTRGGNSSGRIRVPRGLFRSCRHCYGTGREDPRAFATFIHRIFTSRGGRFGNSSIASRGRRGRGRRY